MRGALRNAAQACAEERTPVSAALLRAVPAICSLAAAVAHVALLVALVRRNLELGVAGAVGAAGARRRDGSSHCGAVARHLLGQRVAAQRLPAALRSLERLGHVDALGLRAGGHRAPRARRRERCANQLHSVDGPAECAADPAPLGMAAQC